MPALRSIVMLAVFLGTVIAAVGVFREWNIVAVAGGLMWAAGVAVGLLRHRIDPDGATAR